ncbi:MAG: imidazole glycerol phosphate synthase subunit HisH [Patescibacteria group bacterium]|nr:imidazole glycerol phosphate synthase subunit HisH [Patescibacteria group bacterium]
MIVIVDYGMGNLRSILKKFERLKVQAIVSSKTEHIEKANKLILPGVGHFGKGIKNIKKSNLLNVLNKKVLKEKTPILGICLGMQLFSNFSEEGNAGGLAWINGRVKRFQFDNSTNLRIPHVGWNTLRIKKRSILLKGVISNTRFYFVHSYYLSCKDSRDIIATTDYGNDFVSIVEKNNIYGVQFHPEKSHQIGLKLIKNFVDYS